MNYPLVTIGIPTYNRASGYFKEALECALVQDYPNLEIIISDNCSTDNTESVVESYHDSRINYIKQSTALHPNDNFNFCLNSAKGDYFLLLHDDDLVDADFVETCLKAVNYRFDVGLIRTGARLIDTDGKVIGEKKNFMQDLSIEDFILSWLESKTWMFLCSTLFNTQGLKDVGGIYSMHQLFQDVTAEFKVAGKYGRFDIEDIKGSMRKHQEQNTMAVRVNEWCEDSIQLLDLLLSLSENKKDLIKMKGNVHFSKHNYDLAMSINSPFEKMRNLIDIYKAFDRSLSPLTFIYNKKLRPVLRRFKKRLF